MNTNRHELLLKEEVFQVVGCAMAVLNELGHGLLEKPYENALVLEFGLRSIPFQQQPHFEVMYKGISNESFCREEEPRINTNACF
jgi:GxxExxY protein